MGDRANIYLVDRLDGDSGQVLGGIYLYTHWCGAEWPEELARALDADIARNRWDDPAYLARIITQSVFADLANEDTGGGISTILCDNEHNIIVADLDHGKVWFAKEGQEKNSRNWWGGWGYEDYVQMVLSPTWEG